MFFMKTGLSSLYAVSSSNKVIIVIYNLTTLGMCPFLKMGGHSQ